MPNDQRSESKGLCGVFETTSGAIYVGVPQYEFIFLLTCPTINIYK